MKSFTKPLLLLLLTLSAVFLQQAAGQSILNPADTVYTYNSSAPQGSPTNPNAPATAGVIGKWIRTVRMGWNTNNWKCYIYNGVPFRLRFPASYNPNANDGKKYPILVFWHGLGEHGVVTDNEYQLYHGGNVFENAVSTGAFDGFVICMQSTWSWGPNHNTYMTQILDYMVANNKLDPFRICINGLSAGGYNTWGFMEMYPAYTATALPMSGISVYDADTSYIKNFRFTPIWDFQGGLDGSPAPYTASYVVNAIQAAGGNILYHLYPTLGHGTWDSTWAQPDFFPWLNRAYMANPWALHGRTQFCPGDVISDTLGVAPLLDGYQWRKDGAIIPGATSNTYVATQNGTYDCRMLKGSVWSDWSHVPVVIQLKPTTITPVPAVSGLMSNVIPSPASTGVTLTEPSGYTSYQWKKVGDTTTLGTNQSVTVTKPGQYIAQVTELYGCSTNWSAPFTVINANGPNKPDAATGLIAAPVSQTSILLVWSRNPNPVNKETGYEIFQSTQSGGPYKLVFITGLGVTKDTVTGLNAGTKYYFVVRAVDSTGAAALSNEASVITQADTIPPTAPSNLSITGTSRASISIAWTASTDNVGVTGYDIYVNGQKSYSVPGTQTSFTLLSLTTGQSYGIYVKAKDQAGNNSAASNMVSGEAILSGLSYSYYTLPTTTSVLPNFSTLTPAAQGTMPNISTSPATQSNYFGFLWQGYINIPTDGTYAFQTYSDDGSAVYLGQLNAVGSPYSFGSTPTVNNDGLHGAQYGTSANLTLKAGIYPIAVVFFQGPGGYTMALNWKTPSSGGNFVAVPNSAFNDTYVNNGNAPAAPSKLVSIASSYNSVQLTWNSNSNNETGFEVWRSTTVTGGYTTIGTTSPGATGFTDNGVTGSTRYYYQVRAVNNYGQSPFASSYTEAEWKFNNNYADSTGNGHVLTLVGTPTFDAANKAEGAASIMLSGSGQALTISNSGSFVQENYSQRTIAFWMKANSVLVTNQVLFDIGGSSNGLALLLNSGRLIAAVASGGTRSSVNALYTSTGWNHIAVVYNGDSLLLYINGSLAASNTSLSFHSIATTTDGARIGATNGSNAYNNNGNYFSGWIDDLGIFNTAFTADVITGLINFSYAQSNTTTQPTPAAPAAPTGLTATATGPYGVNVTWTNNSANAANIQVYRSSANNQNYVLWATLPGNAVSYKDTSLFSNAIYYYKVNAVNVGGTSAYSNEGSVTTKDVPPVITKLGSQQARYGTTTMLTVSATSINSGALTFTGLNLPAFASFTDNGNRTATLTLNPAITDQGTYSPAIVVADAFGGTDTTKFSLAINNNYPPTLDTLLSVSMNEGDTLTIPINGHNVNASDTLTISVKNVPNAYTLTQTGNGTANLLLHPTFAAAGAYTVCAKVNDNNGLSASRKFILTVNHKDPNIRTYIRAYGGDTITGVWNNLYGVASTGFHDERGNNTGVGLTMSPNTWWATYNGGQTTGNNSGVYPDAVLKDYYYFSYFGGPDTVTSTLNNLDTSKLYNLTFFANSAWNGVLDNGTTVYQAGGQSVGLHVQANTQNTVTIFTLKPNADGTLPFRMFKAAGNTSPGYFNALVLTQQYDDGTAPVSPFNLQAVAAPTQGGVQLTWQDKAYNERGYNIYRAGTAAGPYTVIGSVASKTVSFIDSTVSGNTPYYYSVQAFNNHGVSGYTDTAYILTANRIPKVNPIADVTMDNTQSTTVNVVAVDDPSVHLTLTVNNLPSFASFVDNGNGTGTININPGAGNRGVYTGITVTAKDPIDSSGSASFNLYVTEKNISSTYINFTDTAMAAKPWNNMTGYPLQGNTITNLTDDGGVNTGISVTIQGNFDGVAGYGMRPRTRDGVYPEAVTSTCIFALSTDTRGLQISGLNSAKRYNFVLYGSFYDGTNNSNDLTHYSINGQTLDLNGSYNNNKTVQFNNIAPDANGNVLINITKDAAAYVSVINSLVIQAYDPNVVTFMSPADLRVTKNTKNAITLQWQDRSYNETGFEIWRSTGGSSYSLLTTVGQDVTSYTDANLANDTYYYYTVRAAKIGATSAYSNAVVGYTYGSMVEIAFNSATTSQGPSPWNNLANVPQPGFVWSNFINDLGIPTNLGMVETGAGWAGIYAGGGASTGNNSGIYPDAVLANSYVLFPGEHGEVQVTGLNFSKAYDFSLLASVTGTYDANTLFTVNGKMSVLNATLNTQYAATVYDVVPDANGNVTIQVDPFYARSQFGMLSALVIKGHTPAPNGAAPPATPVDSSMISGNAAIGSMATAKTLKTDSTAAEDANKLHALTAYPNPFDQYFMLAVPASDNDQITVSVNDMNGKLLYLKRFEGLYAGMNYLRIQPDQPLSTGVYFVTIINHKGEHKTIRVVRK